jgi:malate dehydrogenase (oxaloacetate-decarboxylating)(NADP+)
LAALARAHVPEEVAKAYGGHAMVFGPQYIIPVPFDPRLIYTIPVAVAKAAMESGVARKPILSFSAYAAELSSRLNPTANTMNLLFHRIVKHPRRMIFSEGEEESIIRAAVFWRDSGYGTPILVGREDRIHARMKAMGIERLDGMVIENASLQPERLEAYIDFLYRRLQRSGFLYRDCARLVTRDRHVFASLLLAHDQGDALVGGLTRNYSRTLDRVRYVINQESGAVLCGMSVLVAQGRTIVIADTTVHEYPTAEQLAMIARQAAAKLRHLGYVPRVAFLSYYSFGRPSVSASMVRGQQESDVTARALALLDQQGCDFEYEGELAADVALNRELLALYPFSRLTEPANVLIMPGLRSANIASKLLQELGGGMSIGPILLGLEQPVQILEMGATVSEILNIAAFAAVRSIDEDGLDA